MTEENVTEHLVNDALSVTVAVSDVNALEAEYVIALKKMIDRDKEQ